MLLPQALSLQTNAINSFNAKCEGAKCTIEHRKTVKEDKKADQAEHGRSNDFVHLD